MHLKDYENAFVLNLTMDYSKFHLFSKLHVLSQYRLNHLYLLLCVLLQTERDVSVRQRAVDLLYAMCDRSNAQQIVAEMLNYLETADYSIREEIVRYLCFLKFFHSWLWHHMYHLLIGMLHSL